ncbi:hypothetical protein F5884DRAFT_801872 [Xylogone sp. PMI_703]|nr:hypothetical protein F5884DRAFT_801872 [Xylogone sp. PMI_703]
MLVLASIAPAASAALSLSSRLSLKLVEVWGLRHSSKRAVRAGMAVTRSGCWLAQRATYLQYRSYFKRGARLLASMDWMATTP